jgi:hypothetical protein
MQPGTTVDMRTGDDDSGSSGGAGAAGGGQAAPFLEAWGEDEGPGQDRGAAQGGRGGALLAYLQAWPPRWLAVALLAVLLVVSLAVPISDSRGVIALAAAVAIVASRLHAGLLVFEHCRQQHA